jgi:hypothetical protein
MVLSFCCNSTSNEKTQLAYWLAPYTKERGENDKQNVEEKSDANNLEHTHLPLKKYIST